MKKTIVLIFLCFFICACSSSSINANDKKLLIENYWESNQDNIEESFTFDEEGFFYTIIEDFNYYKTLTTYKGSYKVNNGKLYLNNIVLSDNDWYIFEIKNGDAEPPSSEYYINFETMKMCDINYGKECKNPFTTEN